MGQRVLVCGDRNWTDLNLVRNVIKKMHERESIEVIIEGECRGADKFGRIVAEELGIPVLPFPANWAKEGKAAGHIRNQKMIDEGRPTLILAFHPSIDQSRGTADMLKRAANAEIHFM